MEASRLRPFSAAVPFLGCGRFRTLACPPHPEGIGPVRLVRRRVAVHGDVEQGSGCRRPPFLWKTTYERQRPAAHNLHPHPCFLLPSPISFPWYSRIGHRMRDEGARCCLSIDGAHLLNGAAKSRPIAVSWRCQVANGAVSGKATSCHGSRAHTTPLLPA